MTKYQTRPGSAGKARAIPHPDDTTIGRIEGDPGVGGLLADPQQSRRPSPSRGPVDATPTPDPPPPDRHGDWPPNREWRGKRR